MGTNNTDVITTTTNRNILIEIIRNDSSKNAVARSAGIPLTTFSRKINGHGDFSIRELGSIAAALGTTLDTLLPLDLIAGREAA